MSLELSKEVMDILECSIDAVVKSLPKT
jgi:hypothetical protein